MNLNLLIKAASFVPSRLEFPDAWIGHIPFAQWLINILQPTVFAELGTHSGNSYLAFCQAVKENNLQTRCYAVDTWKGDVHSGLYSEDIFASLDRYHSKAYAKFSSLLRLTFDEAVYYFPDHSIDLLHIDGLHTYDAVKHDFETWLPKLTSQAVVIFHDTNVREREFGVWRFWQELCQKYPYHFEFIHSHGLGVIQLASEPIHPELDFLNPDFSFRQLFLDYFASLGQRITDQYHRQELEKTIIDFKQEVDAHQATLQSAQTQLIDRDAQTTALQTRMVEQEQLVLSLQAQLADKEKQIVELAQQISTISAEKTRLEEESLTQTQRAQSFQSQIAEYDRLSQSLQTQLTETEQYVQALQNQLAERTQQVENLQVKVGEQTQQTEVLQQQQAEWELRLSSLQTRHSQELEALRSRDSQDLESLRAQLTGEIDQKTRLQNDLTNLKNYANQREQILQDLNNKLLEIYSSTAWKIIQRMWKTRLWLAPKGGWREQFARRIFNIHRSTITESKTNNLLLQQTDVQSSFPLATTEGETSGSKTVVSNLTLLNGEETVYKDMLSIARGEEGSQYVAISEIDLSDKSLPVQAIAFYLPQYHPIPENDQWWGKGFTEWTNVSKAVPQFLGHYQPHLPGELGFYDLRVREVQRRQVELAKKYGIFGFCFYYYWFNGKRLLERPLDQFISDPEIDFPFCLCWANENWTRRWDGLDNEILIAQEYSPENDFNFIKDVAPILKHKNYIRIQGRPLLLVYRVQTIPGISTTVARWRKYCQEIGIENPYMVAVQSFSFYDPREFGFDAAVEFPPHNFNARDITDSLDLINADYAGRAYLYTDIVEQFINRNPQALFRTFKTVFPQWDNEPRRPGNSDTFSILSSPAAYYHWLKEACRITMETQNGEERLVFINAWNEWGEGAHLEPDRIYGYAYLQATADALCSLNKENPKQDKTNSLFHRNVIKRNDTAVILHLYYPDLWEEMIDYLANLKGKFDLFLSIPQDVNIEDKYIHQHYPDAYIYRCENRGRDIAPFLSVFRAIYPLGYRYFCKLHTKKSKHRIDGDQWRTDMLNNLLGSETAIQMIKKCFDENEEIGIIGPQGHVLSSTYYWGKNEENVVRLSHKFGLMHDRREFPFVAGSMFWFTPRLFYPFTVVPIGTEEFDIEQRQVDGTLAHAMERFFGLLAYCTSYKIAEASYNCINVIDRFSLKPEYPFATAQISPLKLS